MRLDRFIARSRIIDIQSSSLEGALSELLAVSPLEEEGPLSRKNLLNMLLERESSMTTCLGNGILLPHLKLPIKRSYIFAVGRCADGLEYEGLKEYREIRLIFLLLASEEEDSYLNVLAALGRIFHDNVLVDKLTATTTLESFRDQTKMCFGGVIGRKQELEPKPDNFNQLVLRESIKIAKGVRCTSLMVFGDVFPKGVELDSETTEEFNTILVTQSASESPTQEGFPDSFIQVKSFSGNRLSQMRSAILIGLTRGILQYDERVCCIGGLAKSERFDSIVVVDIKVEFQAVFNKQSDMLPSCVKPEVMERVLAISTELAVEGREGKPVGCIFVLGDADDLKPFIKPLILNPFYGYRDEDRNILNPFMDETVKEYSSIDGAFIVRGDGVLLSAGSLIHAPDYQHELPSGLGTRHAAGAAISLAADCISIIVSASTGQVTLFRRGQLLPIIEKSIRGAP